MRSINRTRTYSRLTALALAGGLALGGTAQAQFGAAGAAGGAGGAAGAGNAAAGAGGGAASSGGNAAALGSFGTGNATTSSPGGGLYNNGSFNNGAVNNNYAAGGGFGNAGQAAFASPGGYGQSAYGSGGTYAGQTVGNGSAAYNPNISNPAGPNAYGFNPNSSAGSGYQANLNNLAGPNAFYNPATAGRNNPATYNPFSPATPGLGGNGAANNPLIGNPLGNQSPGFGSNGSVPLTNPNINNIAGNNVQGFNPALNGGNNPFGTSFGAQSNIPGLGSAGGFSSGNSFSSIGYFNPFTIFTGPTQYGSSYSPGVYDGGNGYAPDYYNSPRYSPYYDATAQLGLASMYGNRYNYNSGATNPAYQAATFYGPIALATGATNYRSSAAMHPRYRLTDNGMAPIRDKSAASAAAGPRRGDLLPREKVIDSTGAVLWPAAAPNAPAAVADARKAVDNAVSGVVDESNRLKRATVRDVVDARNKVADYMKAAAKTDAGDQSLDRFAASLDRALAGLGRSQAVASSVTNITPDGVGKTAGSVVRDALKADTAKPTPAPEAQPPAAPRNAGAVVKGDVPKR